MCAEGFAPEGLVGREVVIDTSGQFVYLGTLKSADAHFLELADADVHDCTESGTSKEVYIIDAKKFGVKKNRGSVFVRAPMVVSISRLSDIVEY